MRLRTRQLVVTVPVLEYVIVGLVAVAMYRGGASGWHVHIGMAALGLACLALALEGTRVALARGDRLLIGNLFRRHTVDRRGARMAYRVRDGRSWVFIDLVIEHGDQRVVLTGTSAVGYAAAARRARRLARAIAADLSIEMSEAGLEAPELEAELAASQRATWKFIVVAGAIGLAGAVGGGVAWWIWLTRGR